MTLELLSLLVTSIVVFLFGAFILLRTYQRLYGWLYALFVLAVVLWALGDFLLLHGDNTQFQSLGITLFYLAPVFIPVFILFFIYSFPSSKLPPRNIVYQGIISLALWCGLLFFDNTLLVDEFNNIDELYIPEISSPMFLLYSLHFIYFFSISYYVLYKKIKNVTYLPTKNQLYYTLVGVLSASLLAMITNLMLPLLGIGRLIWLGPVFTIVFVILQAIAILKHQLFNIRLAVARFIAYLLSWTLLAVAYAAVLISFSNLIFGADISFNAELVFYIFTGMVLATSLVPIRAYFDKYTNRVFYRDAYDTQEFLDDLNKVLVSKVDLEPLLESTTEVISRNLKNSFTSFYIRKTQYIKTRLLGDNLSHYDERDFERISQRVSHVHQSVIAIDDFEEDEELKGLMQGHDIAVLARLVTNIEYELEGVGFLALGPKRSGSPYTRQDIKMIEIIANELVIAIQNALRFEEIEEFNVTLQQKVDDATKKLRKTNEKLKEMDETKDEFISMASHQLRTPLTSVKGYLSMVLEGDAGDIKPMQEKLLSQAFTSSQRMVYLIADLLNVSRLRTGKFVIEKIRANLADIVQGEVDQLKETAFSRDLKLTYEKPDDFPELMIDETKVRQVIMNFIDNAIYYTPSGGSITVKLEDKVESVEYTVTDTGMGVPKQDQQHLFTKFYRAGNARKARPDGTGLGLFMAKKVIVAQEGAVIFRSKEGEGSTFGFTFPKKALMPPEKSKKVDI